MKGKLIKRGKDDYKLFVNDTPYAQSKKSPYKKLSLKNCQAIENGYDLDELAKVNYDCDPYIAEYLEHEFKKGFQKALEILGDKKFSEVTKKIDSMVDFSKDNFTPEVTSTIQMFADNLKFNIEKIEQQTEWDCTFNPDEKDSDGCLILRRK